MRDLLPEHPAHLPTGRVARVEHPTDGMRSLTRQRERPVWLTFKPCPPCDQLADVAGDPPRSAHGPQPRDTDRHQR